ncbi:TasA family protein [Clavibacter michiganensis]|uniref:TasA family protein n=1 Tax=Clavibacter michiganensis TaxID=28447 RepID=UPI0005BA598B|nr:TasA family protein [Clavibacter michiganensis]
MSTTATTPRRRPWKKIVATGAVLAVGTIVAGGAFAIFTDSDTADLAVDAGQLDIELASGDYTVADIAPGDTVQRQILLSLPNATNDGNLIQSVNFAYAIAGQTAGTDDTTLPGGGESLVTGADGLTYSLQTCSGAWTTAAAGGVGPYTCSGTTTVTGTGPLASLTGAGASFTPAQFGVTPSADGTFPTDTADVSLDTLMVLQLPTTADNDYENASVDLTFTASAIQRAGVQR